MAFFKLMRYYFSIVLFLLAFNCFGQSFDVKISKDELRVGDIFELEYIISDVSLFPNAIQDDVLFPVEILTLDTVADKMVSPVEILSVKDTIINNDGVSKAVRSFQLIAWDSCALSLIGFDYVYEDSIFKFPPVFVNVSFYDSEDGVELMDLNEDFHEWNKKESSDSKESKFWWILVIILIFSTVLITFLVRGIIQRKREEFHKTLQEITLEQIENLKSEELWRKGLLKEHFVKFSHILRAYLTGRFGISFLDKTTQQSIILLDSLKLDEKVKNNVLELLKKSDLVKFADSRIEEAYINVLFKELASIIIHTTPIPEES